jgi:hypothetical protein
VEGRIEERTEETFALTKSEPQTAYFPEVCEEA